MGDVNKEVGEKLVQMGRDVGPVEGYLDDQQEKQQEVARRLDDLQASPQGLPTDAPATILSDLIQAPPPTMPLPEQSSARLARRRSVARQQQRRGRTSTILTEQDSLGG